MNDHPAWEAFTDYAKENGIGLEFMEDWEPWWNCYREAWEKGVERGASQGALE